MEKGLKSGADVTSVPHVEQADTHWSLVTIADHDGGKESVLKLNIIESSNKVITDNVEIENGIMVEKYWI